VKAVLGLIVSLAASLAVCGSAAATAPPPWTKHLIIYEVNPKGFTSPDGVGDGDGSGTFDSLGSRLPYLDRLGITGIWLAGSTWANDHFFGIWSNYGAYRPDKLDPTLGTRRDFKAMIRKAHRLGIRVFLDVVSHGVVDESPLIDQHPDWFDPYNPFSRLIWRMTAYRYENPEFFEWWVRNWTRMVTEYGVDGFRVDLFLGDPEVWDRVTQNAAAAGHRIAVFGELERYHFGQHDNLCSSCDPLLEAISSGQRFQSFQISSHDEGYFAGPGNYYQLRGSRFEFAYKALFAPYIPLWFGGEEFNADQVNLPNLRQGLYGEGGPGGWLYGSQLIWRQRRQPGKAAMLTDARRIIAIRRENREILHADRAATHIADVSATGNGPTPYIRYLPGRKGILVLGNDDRSAPLIQRLDVPLDEIGLGGRTRFRVTDLFRCKASTMPRAELESLEVRIPPDATPGGGFRVFRIEPASSRPERCGRRIGVLTAKSEPPQRAERDRHSSHI
jgi:hypothetical protein